MDEKNTLKEYNCKCGKTFKVVIYQYCNHLTGRGSCKCGQTEVTIN